MRTSDAAAATGNAILFVNSSDDAYGADRVLLQLAVDALRRGWHPLVVLPDDVPPGWLSRELREAGIEIIRGPLGIARRRNLRLVALPAYAFGLLRARRFLRRTAKRAAVSIVHVNTSAVLVAAMLGRPGGARIVWHVHEIVVQPRPIAWLLRRLPARSADRTVAISRAVAAWLAPPGAGRPPIDVVPNGIPDRPVVPPPDGPLTVLFLGRLNRWKGYEVVIDAVGRLVPAVDVRLVVAGSPPPGEEWRGDDVARRVREAGLDSRTHLVGFAPDAPALIDAAGIVVVPSVWPEPFGLVTLEAMRAGRAIVATAHGASVELLTDGTSGLLVPPGDAAALAEALRRLAEDPAERTRLGAGARAAYEERYTETRFLDAMSAIYRDLLA